MSLDVDGDVLRDMSASILTVSGFLLIQYTKMSAEIDSVLMTILLGNTVDQEFSSGNNLLNYHIALYIFSTFIETLNILSFMTLIYVMILEYARMEYMKYSYVIRLVSTFIITVSLNLSAVATLVFRLKDILGERSDTPWEEVTISLVILPLPCLTFAISVTMIVVLHAYYVCKLRAFMTQATS